jgi:hypothetical protein
VLASPPASGSEGLAVYGICAWCKKELDDGEDFAARGLITHGICSVCALELTSSGRRTPTQLLALVREPVILVDSEGVVRGANSAAEELFGKTTQAIADTLGGDVFECEYAARPGGCGKTVHCETCTIRNSVLETLRTGRGCSKVPAYQSIRRPSGPEVVRFLISTEKVGDRILLRIDDAVTAGDGDEGS